MSFFTVFMSGLTINQRISKVIIQQPTSSENTPVSAILPNYSQEINHTHIVNAAISKQTGRTRARIRGYPEVHPGSGFIYMTHCAQLGNNLFQIASLSAMAHKTGRQLILDMEYKYLLTHFPNLQKGTITFGSNSSIARIINETGHSKYNPEIFTNVKENIYIPDKNYFQSWKYFQEYYEETIWLFTFSNMIISSAQ